MNKISASMLLAATLLAVLFPPPAQAFEIYWDIEGQGDNPVITPSIGDLDNNGVDLLDFDLLVDATDLELVHGSGVTLVTGDNDAFVTSGWNNDTANDFIEFTVTPGPGEAINFSDALAELTIDLQTDISGFQFSVYTDQDGYTTPVATSATYTGTFNPSVPGSYASAQLLDLSSVGTITSSVTFRIIQDAGSGSGSVYIYANTTTNPRSDMGIFPLVIRREIINSVFDVTDFTISADFVEVEVSEEEEGPTILETRYQVTINTTNNLSAVENVQLMLMENTTTPANSDGNWVAVEGGFDGGVSWDASDVSFTARPLSAKAFYRVFTENE
jgi:hypothetical protein